MILNFLIIFWLYYKAYVNLNLILTFMGPSSHKKAICFDWLNTYEAKEKA